MKTILSQMLDNPILEKYLDIVAFDPTNAERKQSAEDYFSTINEMFGMGEDLSEVALFLNYFSAYLQTMSDCDENTLGFNEYERKHLKTLSNNLKSIVSSLMDIYY